MEIYSFNELSEAQKRNIYQFTTSFEYTGGFGSCDEMAAFYGGTAFDGGCSHFSLWEDGRPVGTLGVVAKEAALRGEIFMTGIGLKEPDAGKLSSLLDRAFAYCSEIKNVRYKLGLNHDRYYLMPAVKENGFKEVYRYLEMNYSGGAVTLPPEEEKCFKLLSSENIKDFQRVHNEAFLLAPNGAAIDEAELPQYLEEYGTNGLAGIYYDAGIAAGVYILKQPGDHGYIDGIGVAPEFHGRGIGKSLLFKSIKALQDAGAAKIGLSVFDSNKRALEMYLKNGFETEKEHSVWFEK